MSSEAPGKNTSGCEGTQVSANGARLLAGGREYFMSFEDFPWFKDASTGKILKVEQPAPGHFRWPELDVDLTTGIIGHPERFPLKSR